MSARIPKPGEIFRGDDGPALVVASGTAPADALLLIVEAHYGSPKFSPGNPAIVAALPKVRVAEWRSCSKEWRESECVGDEYTESWWAPHGDGRRVVTVAVYDGNAYDLGNAAESAESPVAAAVSGVAGNPEEAGEK